MLSSSIDPLEILTDALREKRPLVLFAGQSLDSAHDAILSALLDRLDAQIVIQDGAPCSSRT